MKATIAAERENNQLFREHFQGSLRAQLAEENSKRSSFSGHVSELEAALSSLSGSVPELASNTKGVKAAEELTLKLFELSRAFGGSEYLSTITDLVPSLLIPAAGLPVEISRGIGQALFAENVAQSLSPWFEKLEQHRKTLVHAVSSNQATVVDTSAAALAKVLEIKGQFNASGGGGIQFSDLGSLTADLELLSRLSGSDVQTGQVEEALKNISASWAKLKEEVVSFMPAKDGPDACLFAIRARLRALTGRDAYAESLDRAEAEALKTVEPVETDIYLRELIGIKHEQRENRLADRLPEVREYFEGRTELLYAKLRDASDPQFGQAVRRLLREFDGSIEERLELEALFSERFRTAIPASALAALDHQSPDFSAQVLALLKTCDLDPGNLKEIRRQLAWLGRCFPLVGEEIGSRIVKVLEERNAETEKKGDEPQTNELYRHLTERHGLSHEHATSVAALDDAILRVVTIDESLESALRKRLSGLTEQSPPPADMLKNICRSPLGVYDGACSDTFPKWCESLARLVQAIEHRKPGGFVDFLVALESSDSDARLLAASGDIVAVERYVTKAIQTLDRNTVRNLVPASLLPSKLSTSANQILLLNLLHGEPRRVEALTNVAKCLARQEGGPALSFDELAKKFGYLGRTLLGDLITFGIKYKLFVREGKGSFRLSDGENIEKPAVLELFNSLDRRRNIATPTASNHRPNRQVPASAGLGHEMAG